MYTRSAAAEHREAIDIRRPDVSDRRTLASRPTIVGTRAGCLFGFFVSFFSFLSFFLPFSSFREREIFIFLFFFSRIFCEFKESVVRCFKGIWVWDKNWTLDFFFFFFFSREGGRFCVDDFFQEFYGINWLVIKISMFDDFESLIGY